MHARSRFWTAHMKESSLSVLRWPHAFVRQSGSEAISKVKELPMISQRKSALALLLGMLFASGIVPATSMADSDDPPSRVARLAYLEGSISFQPGGTEEWVAAPLNRPITTGDKIWSDQGSRAELQLDGSALRLSSNTAVSFLNLGDNVSQIQLSVGTLLLRVRRLDDNETYEIDTPNLAFSVLQPGVYRFTVDE